MIEHYLSMLRPLGIESPAVRFDLPETDADARSAEKFLRARGLAGRRFAILNPGAAGRRRCGRPCDTARWPAIWARRTACRASRVWGTADERPLAERIVETSARHAHLAPPTTMRELAALCRRAALFVGSDTGPMHLAVAVGTPTISLHGPSRAEWCGAYGPQNIRLQVRYEAGSSLERRKADDSAMREITSKWWPKPATSCCGQQTCAKVRLKYSAIGGAN